MEASETSFNLIFISLYAYSMKRKITRINYYERRVFKKNVTEIQTGERQSKKISKSTLNIRLLSLKETPIMQLLILNISL